VTYLAEGIEDMVEINQDFAFGNLCDVVHSLTGIVTDPSILIREACKHRRDNSFKVFRQFLGGKYVGMCSCNSDRSKKQKARGSMQGKSG
jgi:hypothetical protein